MAGCYLEQRFGSHRDKILLYHHEGKNNVVIRTIKKVFGCRSKLSFIDDKIYIHK